MNRFRLSNWAHPRWGSVAVRAVSRIDWWGLIDRCSGWRTVFAVGLIVVAWEHGCYTQSKYPDTVMRRSYVKTYENVHLQRLVDLRQELVDIQKEIQDVRSDLDP